MPKKLLFVNYQLADFKKLAQRFLGLVITRLACPPLAGPGNPANGASKMDSRLRGNDNKIESRFYYHSIAPEA